jgi:hypothetical protein
MSEVRKKLTKLLTKVDAVQQWLRLRKNTVIAHWLFGILCAVAIIQYAPFGCFLLLLFALFEYWNDKNMAWRKKDYIPEGDMDWWDSFSTLCISIFPALILNWLGIISIRWI